MQQLYRVLPGLQKSMHFPTQAMHINAWWIKNIACFTDRAYGEQILLDASYSRGAKALPPPRVSYTSPTSFMPGRQAEEHAHTPSECFDTPPLPYAVLTLMQL